MKISEFLERVAQSDSELAVEAKQIIEAVDNTSFIDIACGVFLEDLKKPTKYQTPAENYADWFNWGARYLMNNDFTKIDGDENE